jgi:hypothetical protein
MDSALLVKNGRKLMELLSEDGMSPRAVMWVHNTDTDTWRLWIIPPEDVRDKRDFYRKLGVIISANRDALGGLDSGDVEMVPAAHPAIQALGGMFRVDDADVHLTQNMLNGFFLPDGIILRMML